MTRLLSMIAGTGVLMLVSAGASTASAVGPATLASAAACTGDLNGDGKVDGADLGILLANWGKPGATDLDGNGTTDGADQAILMGAWGPCPTEVP
ncbi:MAG: hypothetical protein ACYTFH_09485 [Planctomycetota bacterium]|jgi:hypothetical protein